MTSRVQGFGPEEAAGIVRDHLGRFVVHQSRGEFGRHEIHTEVARGFRCLDLTSCAARLLKTMVVDDSLAPGMLGH